jgi:hypothetical protein
VKRYWIVGLLSGLIAFVVVFQKAVGTGPIGASVNQTKFGVLFAVENVVVDSPTPNIDSELSAQDRANLFRRESPSESNSALRCGTWTDNRSRPQFIDWKFVQLTKRGKGWSSMAVHITISDAGV